MNSSYSDLIREPGCCNSSNSCHLLSNPSCNARGGLSLEISSRRHPDIDTAAVSACFKTHLKGDHFLHSNHPSYFDFIHTHTLFSASFMFQFSALVTLFVVAPVFVSSSPSLPRTFDVLPRGATKLAYDPDTGVISAFDKRGDFIGL